MQLFFSFVIMVFRALHENEERPKGGLTRNQFFFMAFVCSFAYYVFPGYLFPMFTSLSWICWMFPNSIIAQQLGSGLHGLGVGVVGFDWSSICAYLGSPLASPWFATVNIAVGFAIFVYVIIPTAYWLNIYKARRFPILSDELFMSNGQKYNISDIIDSNFRLDLEAYERDGPLYLSISFAMSYGFAFACLAATLVHVLLFHGRYKLHNFYFLFFFNWNFCNIAVNVVKISLSMMQGHITAKQVCLPREEDRYTYKADEKIL